MCRVAKDRPDEKNSIHISQSLNTFRGGYCFSYFTNEKAEQERLSSLPCWSQDCSPGSNPKFTLNQCFRGLSFPPQTHVGLARACPELCQPSQVTPLPHCVPHILRVRHRGLFLWLLNWVMKLLIYDIWGLIEMAIEETRWILGDLASFTIILWEPGTSDDPTIFLLEDLDWEVEKRESPLAFLPENQTQCLSVKQLSQAPLSFLVPGGPQSYSHL